MWPQPMTATPLQTAQEQKRPREFEFRDSSIIVFRRGWIVMRLIDVKTGANRKRQRSKLRCPHLDLQVYHESAHQAEGDLRDHEPRPIDARSGWTNQAQRRVKYSRP